ncbi:DNA-binding MarR family transcriptional regulator [Kribbella kalugense]|uniref:DNA-binding MarR family transcriptional regulator n=2 Tax=Kribbella kalugense TaxID=2512221 RepID=A0A4R8A2U6_9ACTN|nr:DNA-binding MarR family transcriptional regulator [Kribbella kalugense]
MQKWWISTAQRPREGVLPAWRSAHPTQQHLYKCCYNPGMDDPTEQSQWRPLQELLARIDGEIGRIYTDREIKGLKPTYVRELLQLHLKGPMTITELADTIGRTHSALSQKVSAMRTAGLVRTVPGADARSKQVTLTAKSKKIVELLAAEWRATEAAIAELEAELPYPMTQVVRDIEEALAKKSFYDRIAEKLQ